MSRTMVVALVTVALLAGCRKSVTGGGVGDDTFTVGVPSGRTTVTQGETQIIRVSVERGAAFKRDVELEMTAPGGLDVEPDSVTVKPGDKGDVQLTIKADDDAALGEHTVVLLGTPEKGAAVKMELKVTVVAK